MQSPINPLKIKRLQGILESLNDHDNISLALRTYPEVIDPAILAIHEAANASDLPKTVATFPETQFTSSLQMIRDDLSDPQIWLQAGASLQQLLAIANSFEKAKQCIAQWQEENKNRKEQEENEKAHATRMKEHERQNSIQKRIRHITKN